MRDLDHRPAALWLIRQKAQGRKAYNIARSDKHPLRAAVNNHIHRSARSMFVNVL